MHCSASIRHKASNLAMILTAQANRDPKLQPARHAEEDLSHWMAAAAFSSSGAALEALPEGFEPGKNDVSFVE